MEWTQLKYAESHWDLSAAKKNQVAEAVLAQATAPRTFRLPFLKPILAVATLAVCAFALLLAWPKKPVEETVVTLPGASQEAKPDEYVPSENKEPIVQNAEKPSDKPAEEKEPAETVTPDKEEPADPKEPADESVVETPAIHRFWETEKEMPYEEAVAIVKDKLENRFNEPLTDKERMAYYQCISASVYAEYLHELKYYVEDPAAPFDKKLAYADPTSPFYQTDNPWFQVEIITTNDGVGSDFQSEIPLTFEEGYTVFDLNSPVIKETTENSYTKQIYTCYMNREDGSFLEKDSYMIIETKLEYGTGRAVRSFNFENVNILKEKLSRETIEEIVRYYLSFEPAIWINIHFQSGYVDVVLD